MTGPEVRRLEFNLPRMMRTDYYFDRFQPTYFVIDSFAALLEEMETTSLSSIYEKVRGQDLLKPGEAHESDVSVVIGES